MARNNLAPNSSFRNGTSGWTSLNGASLDIVTGISAFYGSEALRVTKTAINDSGVQSADFIPVTAGAIYALSNYVRVPITVPGNPTAGLRSSIRWHNAAGKQIGESQSGIAQVSPATTWTRLSTVTVAPAEAVYAVIVISQLVAGTSGSVFYVDAVLFEQAEFVGGYIDNYTHAEKMARVNTALSPLQAKTAAGLQLDADVILGDLVLNTIDEQGVIWVCTDINGWWSQAEPEIPDVTRGDQDGSYDVTGRYTARQLELTGVILTTDPDMVSAARDRLIAATNLVRKGAWLRTNEEPTRASYVRLSGRPKIATVNARGRTEFSIGLRAADPVKYGWNDADNEGKNSVLIDGEQEMAVVTNIGTADVPGIFRVTGPVGAGSTIYNSETDETMTIIQELRGAGLIAKIIKRELYKNEVTITTENPHRLLVGDHVDIARLGAPFDSTTAPFVVTAASSVYPYTFSYSLANADIPSLAANGSVSLANTDVLEIDTYNRAVSFNGSVIGHRSKVDTLVDWIKFAPGNNTVVFDDNINPYNVINKQYEASGLATLKVDDPHFLTPGESVTIELPETAALSRKSLTNNVATLITAGPHGFSTGDSIDVVSTEVSAVTNKELLSNVATLTTSTNGGFVVGDSIVVDLPVTRNVIGKSLTGGRAYLTTAVDHEYSEGDSLTIALPTTTAVVAKSLQTNRATIHTAAAHNFSLNDSVTVALPTVASVIQKSTTGASVIMKTNAAHGFSVNDRVQVNLPTTAAVTGTRSFAGSSTYLATLNTTAAHGFVPGDVINVALGVSDTMTVTNRIASTTVCTLVTAATHNVSVGELITVTGVSDRYNGTHVVTQVNAASRTITYTKAGAAENSVASGGSVVNETLRYGYNGAKVIEAVTSTSISYRYTGHDNATSSTILGSSPTITNTTNQALNGVNIITSTPSATDFTYTRSGS